MFPNLVHPESNENHARIMGLNSADGEYMLLGRVTDESQNVFIQFSSAPAGVTNWTVNAPSSATGTPEPPLQVGVWADGLRLLVRSSTQLTVTADIQKAPVNGLPEGYSVICKCRDYRSSCQSLFGKQN